MTGIQQKLPVPFRTQNGTLNNCRFVSQLPHRIGHAAAGGLVQLRFAHDSTLAHLSLAGLELGLDKYNHFAVRL